MVDIHGMNSTIVLKFDCFGLEPITALGWIDFQAMHYRSAKNLEIALMFVWLIVSLQLPYI